MSLKQERSEFTTPVANGCHRVGHNPMNDRGLYIVVEGVNGSGKSTLAETLAEHMRSSDRSVEVRGEPDRRSIIGQRVREWLREDVVVSPTRLQEGMTWARLDFMGRLQKYLAAGIDVIAERSWLSGVVYAAISKFSPFSVCQIQKDILGDNYIIPDLMILVDVPAEEADRRIGERPIARRRFDNLKSITKAREIYLEIWAGRIFAEETTLLPSQDRWIKIDGCSSTSNSVDVIDRKIRNILANF